MSGCGFIGKCCRVVGVGAVGCAWNGSPSRRCYPGCKLWPSRRLACAPTLKRNVYIGNKLAPLGRLGTTEIVALVCARLPFVVVLAKMKQIVQKALVGSNLSLV